MEIRVEVAFGPDGKAILAESGDNTVRLWDIATGKPIGQPIVHPAGVRFPTLSPDGKTVLTWSGDMKAMEARIWDCRDPRSPSVSPWSTKAP